MSVRIAIFVAAAGLVALGSGCGGPAQSACHRLCSQLAGCYPRSDLSDCHATCDRAPPACANDVQLADTLDSCSGSACGPMLICAWAIAASRPECVTPGSSVPQR